MPIKSFAQRKEDVQRGWKVVDARDQILGRMASKIAVSLRGKDKPTFTPHVDGGDFVVVINADQVRLTGSKLEKKMYHYYTGYRGGLKSANAAQMKQDHPEEMIRRAVWGMLPKGPLGRKMIKKLKVYRGAEHPHSAQKPVQMTV